MTVQSPQVPADAKANGVLTAIYVLALFSVSDDLFVSAAICNLLTLQMRLTL